MINNYTNHPKICSLFSDDNAKNTILTLLILYCDTLSNEDSCAESICRFLIQMHVKREDLLDAVFHDFEFCAIAKSLQTAMHYIPDPDSEENANVICEW